MLAVAGLGGSVVSVLVSSNSTVASPPGASGPYGFEVASAEKLAGSVRLTAPLCDVSDQLCTLTGTVIVSPTPIDCAAAERPRRLACGAVSSSQPSYSSHLPQRSKRPSTGETIRITLSV